MCGRFTMHTPADEVLGHFHLPAGPVESVQLPLRFNIAPMQSVPVVRVSRSEQTRQLKTMRWGLTPFWAKDPKQGARMINARSETAATKRSFRNAFKRRRCLAPSDGYFEWEKRGGKKLPHYIRMKDERLFAYAGLWEAWGERGSDEYVETFAILTTNSNDLTAPVHDRMPVILDQQHYETWLDPDLEDVDVLQPLLAPYPSDAMKMERVSTHVNNVRHDDPNCIAIEQELF